MTGKKKILLQAGIASLGLAFVGVGVNFVNLTASAPYTTEVVADDIHITTEKGIEPIYTRKTPERDGWAGSEPPGADGVSEMDVPPPDYERERAIARERSAASAPLPRTGSGMDRGEAMRRVEDIHVELQGDLLPQHREELEFEMANLLAEHFPTAAAEPVAEYGEPKNGDSHMMADLDVNNIFNKVWGLFQALIVAWATLKMQRRKKEDAPGEDWLTESKLDKIDEELRAKYRTDRIKK